MVEIKWTNFAIQNLNDIGDYIEQHSYRQASKMVNYLFDSVSILETFPYQEELFLNMTHIMCGN